MLFILLTRGPGAISLDRAIGLEPASYSDPQVIRAPVSG